MKHRNKIRSSNIILYIGIVFLISACQKDYLPIEFPVVTRDSLYNISLSTATSGGKVISKGSLKVIARGVCWGAHKDPTILDNFTTDGSGTGSFTSYITGLNGEPHFLRAYATTEIGTAYSRNQTLFYSMGIPTIEDMYLETISSTSASFRFYIINKSESDIISVGVCWSQNYYPTIADNFNELVIGDGYYKTRLTNLSEDTIYYLRAYVNHSTGTSYSIELVFKTLEE